MEERAHAAVQRLLRGIGNCERLGRGGRRVSHGVELAVAEVELFGFGTVKGARTAASENGELVAALIDSAVAVNAARNRERRAGGAIGRDQFRCGARTES